MKNTSLNKPQALVHLDVRAISEGVQRGELSALAVTEAYLARIDAHNDALGAYLHVDRDGALAQAARIDEEVAGAQHKQTKNKHTQNPRCLVGVPVALKDNLCTRGVPTTCASKILEGYRPPYDAHVVERLRAHGAVILGKTNLDEFAMGSSNENSAFFNALNPWDRTRAPGGSSGGSAAATAMKLAAGALGSDTGGSVRQPGAFCGVTAIKPTYGRVSRYGLIAFASSLDQVGPFGRSVDDAARLLQAIAGHDPRDATSATAPHRDDMQISGLDAASSASASASIKGLRVGVLRESVDALEDNDVREAMQTTLRALQDAGAVLCDVTLPHAKHAVSVYYLIAPAEASSNLARFDGMRFGLRAQGKKGKQAEKARQLSLLETYEATRAQGFGPEVKRRIMLGTYALSAGYYDAFYLKAQKVRTLICRDYHTAFEQCDVVLSPTTPTPAFKLGEKTDDPLAMYLADIFTLPASLAGLPALSTPCGQSKRHQLPIGVHLVAPAFHEQRLIDLARVVEASVGITDQYPPHFDLTSTLSADKVAS